MTENKKILAIQDILLKNGRINSDCTNVCYIGDGSTDADALEFVHKNGGTAIFVHQPHSNDKFYDLNNKIYEELNKNGMIDFNLLADYTTGSELSNILK